MAFNRTSDLPEDVRTGMPELAQEIWMNAYNTAAEKGNGDPEGEAYRALEDRYERSGDHWVMKTEGGSPGTGGGVRGPIEHQHPAGIRDHEYSGSSAEEPSPLDQRSGGPAGSKIGG